MIKLKKKMRLEAPSGGGCSANYFQLTKTKGLKVYHEEYETKREAMASEIYVNAKKEARLLRRAAPTGIVPKVYGVKVFKDYNLGSWVVGLIMQHLGDTTLSDQRGGDDVWADHAFDTIQRKLAKVGLAHRDLHGSNVMVFKKKHYVIDFESITIAKI